MSGLSAAHSVRPTIDRSKQTTRQGTGGVCCAPNETIGRNRSPATKVLIRQAHYERQSNVQARDVIVIKVTDPAAYA